MYLGQEIEYGAVHTRDVLTVELLAEIKRFKNPYFQLILRSIEDMTEEEKNELKNRVGLEHEDLVAILCKKVMHLVYLSEMVSIVNYLRSIGVDCDNLIQQGKAIRKEK